MNMHYQRRMLRMAQQMVQLERRAQRAEQRHNDELAQQLWVARMDLQNARSALMREGRADEVTTTR